MGRKNRTTKRGQSRKNFDSYSYEDLPFCKTGPESLQVFTKIKYRNENQRIAHELIRDNVLSFIGGPAGTAKTFLAAAEAVEQLRSGKVEKIILSRPTVEAGGSLGFLPGDFKAKVDPYLIPIYDNLEYFLGKDQLKALVEEEVIQVVPFQLMRGRTLNNAFIILDETQNATKEQLRLALTRIGDRSKCVVTFDEAQLDIHPTKSCVTDIHKFANRNKIGFFKFGTKDIVRSEIVAMVLDIYAEGEDA